ncbi:interferon-inducible GTPase 5-like [Ambystoma mexicanum]|uniref:interferon-inducible GTPase 5-like n=1 Tax=Ambystoma mexicanum TaxID=8296 RepID=UPI0037E96A7A
MEAETLVDLEKWPVGRTQTDGKSVEDGEIVGLPTTFEKGGLMEEASNVLENLRNLENASLDIAVVGESGCGKSTFITSFLGLGHHEDSCAMLNEEEMMSEPTPYPHPQYPKLTLWELTVINSTDFKPAAYLQKVNFSRYDAFIIMASEAFGDFLSQLASELQTEGKRLFLVCSKADIRSEQSRPCRTIYDKGGALKEIREDCVIHLEGAGVGMPRVYLLLCSDLGKLEFELLAEDMVNELPSHKKHTFVLSLPNVSMNILKKKREVLGRQIWKFAMVSCAIGALPIPGLSVVCDVAILVKSLSGYSTAFGLDGPSLEQLAAKADKSVLDLRAVIKSRLTQEVSADLVVKLLANATGGGARIAEFILRQIPVFGSVAAAGLSFGTTYFMLKSSLDEMVEDAQRVLREVLKSES